MNQGKLSAATILELNVVPYTIEKIRLNEYDDARSQAVRQNFIWPARSTNLNLIEHLWDNMERSLDHLSIWVILKNCLHKFGIISVKMKLDLFFAFECIFE